MKNNAYIHWWVCKICVYKQWRLLQLTGALMKGLPLIHLKEGYELRKDTEQFWKHCLGSEVDRIVVLRSHSCSLLTSVILSLSDLLSLFLPSPLFSPPALIFPSAHCCVRSLVDILRHQSSPVQQGERNNTTVLTTTTSDGRMSKNLYTPILQSKDNRSKWEKTHVKNSNPPSPQNKQTNKTMRPSWSGKMFEEN